MTIDIRPMVRRDKSPLMKILRATPEFKPVEVEIAEELIDAFLKEGKLSGYEILIAESEKFLLGYICYGPTPLTVGTWDVYWMAVSHESQGKGIGRSLLEAAESNIYQAEGRLIMIETSTVSLYDKTRRFYLGNGYEIACTIPDFYEPGDGKLELLKRLR